MTYETKLGRSFSRHELKRVGSAAFMCCFLMAMFSLCTVFKPYFGPLPLNIDAESMKATVGNLSNSRSQVYELNGDIRIQGNSSTIFIASTHQQNVIPWTTKPYARKRDKRAMGKVRNFKIMHQGPSDTITPHCIRNFSVPAILFSTGGYAGNVFHDFTDVLIPLYLTSRLFNRQVLFLVADKHSWWTSKYKPILENLSKYKVVDIDTETQVLCFSRMIVGLRSHKELGIDPGESPHYSIKDLRKFLRSTYSLDREFINDCGRLRLLIISRKRTRHLSNEDQVAELARSLGFDVGVKELSGQVASVAESVNGFDVVVGVHGAGLTNMVFLPENAVVIQIVPIGLRGVAKGFFQIPAEAMGLRYLEYNVRLKESSLLGKYPAESDVYRDPADVQKKQGWRGFHSVYMDNQDVIVDLGGFRRTLLRALELLRS